MNLNRAFVLGIWTSVLVFFGCAPKNKEVENYSEFRDDIRSGVIVVFEPKQARLGELLDIQSKTRLQSKTTTVFSCELFYELIVENQKNQDGAVIVLKRKKHIPINLKTAKERERYLEEFKNALSNSDVSKIDLSRMKFELHESSSDPLTDNLTLMEIK